MQNFTKKRRKGFTLTELAVVIAVIAILIAVLVPTFVSLINSANESADEQAVKNMNTALSIHEATEDFDTVSDVVTALAEDNYDLDNYSPLISGMQFYWVKSINRIVYAQSSSPYTVSYPAEYTSLEYTPGNWYSLNGGITLDSSWTVDNNTVEISSGAQLASLMDSFSTYSTGTLTIKLTDNIDLMGASYKFGSTSASKDTSAVQSTGVSGTITITSSESTAYTIYGLRDDTNAVFGQGQFSDKGYGYGLFSCINSGATVTISNVNFNGTVVKDTSLEDNGTLALVAGYCYGTLVIKDVTFTNCYVGGLQKVATIVGQFLSGSVTLENVDFVNTTVSASAEGTKVIAYIPSGSQSFTYDSACDFSGITVVGNDDFASYYEEIGYLGSATVNYTTTLGNSYECLLANYTTQSNNAWGNAMVVATQALYLYQASTNQTAGGYTLRNTNTPGDAKISSGTLQSA